MIDLSIVLRPITFVVPFVALAAPALAEYQVPTGCTAFMTVQSKGCSVTHYYTCEQDPAGHKWRADLNLDGPFFVSQTDDEAQWIVSLDLFRGTTERLSLGANDPASFSELVASGLDTFDFTVIDDKGEETNVVGFDKLTGEEVTIDGVVLQQVENEVTATDGNGDFKWGAKGSEYISLKHRLFLAGPTVWKSPDGEQEYDDSPVEFAFPGDAGFLSETPKYECNSIDAYLDQGETSYDKI